MAKVPHGIIPSGGDSANFTRDILATWAQLAPDRIALSWIDEEGRSTQLSYSQMLDRAGHAAAFLKGLGVRRGDAVMIVMSRELPWWEIMLGCLWLGAVACPATVQLRAHDLRYRVSNAGIRCVIASQQAAGNVEEAALEKELPRVIIGDPRVGWTVYGPEQAANTPLFADTVATSPCLGYFTSGTTGAPKLTLHGAAYPFAHALTARHWLGLDERSCLWNISDTGWAKAAWSTLFAPLIAGSTIFAANLREFSAIRTIEILNTQSVTHLCAPPTAYRMLVQEKSLARFGTLEHCVSAGEPLNPEVIEIWRDKTGLEVADGYGQTETVVLCCNRPESCKQGSMGKPVPGIELEILDAQGLPAGIGVEGDLVVDCSKGEPPGLFLGYLGDKERTAQAKDGSWYRTGDRALRDADGFYWFVGRADDVIISAGYRIGPFEVESALLEHPAVAESAAVASPDAERGEVVKAFIVLVPGCEPDDNLVRDLQSHVKRLTAPYKYPRKIEFVTQLPKTVSGKILRRQLKELEFQDRSLPS